MSTECNDNTASNSKSVQYNTALNDYAPNMQNHIIVPLPRF